jgi:hypothetical protein
VTSGSGRFKRKLTPFLCQEMLYDYAINRLDADRRSAVDEFLKGDEECRQILEAIKQGLSYGDLLAGTKLNPEIEEQLKESENVISLGRKYSSWKEWPEVVRWSITALVISSSVAVLIALVPWSRISLFRSGKRTGGANSIEIAQVPNTVPQQIASAKDAQEIEPSADDETSGDEVGDDGDSVAAAGVPAAGKVSDKTTGKASDKSVESGSGDDVADTHAAPPPAAQALAPIAQPVAVATKPAPLKPKSPSAMPVATTAVEKSSHDEESAPDEASASASPSKEAKPKGFVYRAFMTLPNLDEVGPKIADNIRDLGGEKAGEVELGWKRGTGRYYHFSLPEESEEKILEELRAYGPVRISKDPHPRVMPKGKIRFILWIESGN